MHAPSEIKGQYLAILGRQPELGLVELEALLGSAAVEPFGQHAILTELPDIDRLGGTIKLGEVLYRGPARDVLDLPIRWEELVESFDHKVIFGLSYYGVKATSRFVTVVGLELKKRLRQQGSVRLIAPTEGLVLSAAQLYHHQVLKHGFEVLVAVVGQEMVVARTLGVQDIEAYTARDYGRPARSAKVGMLPPKLAQILVNTTASPLVTDPFCGTGVVLQEALLMNRRAAGSDTSAEMVAASRTNLEWLEAQYPGRPEWSVEERDAREVKLAADTAIVSEGYLGTPLEKAPSSDQLTKLRVELDPLYRQVLRSWAKQLPSGAQVSLCIPSWRVGSGWQELATVDELPDLGYNLRQFAHNDARHLRYSRPNQVVGRRILLLTRE